jgi:hypothetical protein
MTRWLHRSCGFGIGATSSRVVRLNLSSGTLRIGCTALLLYCTAIAMHYKCVALIDVLGTVIDYVRLDNCNVFHFLHLLHVGG